MAIDQRGVRDFTANLAGFKKAVQVSAPDVDEPATFFARTVGVSDMDERVAGGGVAGPAHVYLVGVPAFTLENGLNVSNLLVIGKPRFYG